MGEGDADKKQNKTKQNKQKTKQNKQQQQQHFLGTTGEQCCAWNGLPRFVNKNE